MIARLKRWLGLCEHEWKTIAAHDIAKPSVLIAGNEYIVAQKYTQECQKCHNIRTYTV